MGQCGWNAFKTRIAAEECFTLKWELRRGEATPVLTGSLLSGVRTVCQCSKTFSLYCSQGSPVKLSSACEACFIQPADLQSNQRYFSTLAIHYKKGNWETVCKESTVSNDPMQINVTEPFFKKHPPIGTQPLSLNQAAVFYTCHRPRCMSLYSIYVKVEHLVPSCSLDEGKCVFWGVFLWSSQFPLTI